MFKKLAVLLSLILTITSSTGLVLAEEISVSGNGENSANDVSINVTSQSTLQQNNTSNITNNVSVNATTGDNNASSNTGGNTNITTGNIAINTTVGNSANNSTVNSSCCQGIGISGQISGNGEDSQNNIGYNLTNNSNVAINQQANITNSIFGGANTGDNQANGNNGSTSIQTGNIFVKGKLENSNINNAYARAGIGNGDLLSLSIFGNGENSNNFLNLTNSNNNNVYINNSLNLFNNVYWDLNTGRNKAQGNVGDVSIKTGDIDFIFNILNDKINTSRVIISCCPQGTPKKPDDPGTPKNPDNPAPGDSSPGGSSGGSSTGSVLGAVAGNILPATGSNVTPIIVMLSFCLFLLGLKFKVSYDSPSAWVFDPRYRRRFN